MSGLPKFQKPQEKKPIKKRWWILLFGEHTLLVSILFHVLFLSITTYIVVEHFQKKHNNFQAAGPAPPSQQEHKVQVQKKNDVASAPPDLKRITTTDISPITLPDVPQIPKTEETTVTSLNGVDGTIGQAMGEGQGGGGSGGAGGGMTLYGAPGVGGFVGTLYDLKQTPDRQPTDIGENEVERTGSLDPKWQSSPATRKGLEVLRSFIKTWDMSLLDSYYKAPDTLHATQIFIPVTPSENAPKAFHVEDKVHPFRWIIVYSAKIIPHETGDFRFIGFADDFMAVRVGGQNVLDASWPGEELDSAADTNEDVGRGVEGQPLHCGKWIQMAEGTPLDMQVLIGEGPGGFSGFFLMVQKKGADTSVGDYPAFQLQDAPLSTEGEFPSAFSGKKMVFGVASQEDNPDGN